MKNDVRMRITDRGCIKEELSDEGQSKLEDKQNNN